MLNFLVADAVLVRTFFGCPPNLQKDRLLRKIYMHNYHLYLLDSRFVLYMLYILDLCCVSI